MPDSIFLQFTPPNAATWLYFSLFLTFALFFQFNRPFALRNWDLVGLFLFAPGMLLILDAHQTIDRALPYPGPVGSAEDELTPAVIKAEQTKFIGYVWLLSASAFWFARCLFDPIFRRRSLPSPNLNWPGLVWFSAALLIWLGVAMYSRNEDPWRPVGKQPMAISSVEQGAAAMVLKTGNAPADSRQLRFRIQQTMSAVCHISVVASLIVIGWKLFGDYLTGIASGCLYLLVPYTGYYSSQLHHVWPVALILWAVLLYPRPTVSGALLGVAAGTSFFPVLLLPAWWQFYRGRGTSRFLLSFAITSLSALGLSLMIVLATGTLSDLSWPTLHAADWQPWKVPTAESVWTGAHWAYRLPIFVIYISFVCVTMFWPTVRNLGELIAISAAILIGIQFWYADQGGLYVLWYAPLLILMIVRPNLNDVQPSKPGPWPVWVTGAYSWTIRRFGTIKL